MTHTDTHCQTGFFSSRGKAKASNLALSCLSVVLIKAYNEAGDWKSVPRPTALWLWPDHRPLWTSFATRREEKREGQMEKERMGAG